MRGGFSAIQCSEKPERERVPDEVWDKLCLGVKWSVWLFVDQKIQLYLYSRCGFLFVLIVIFIWILSWEVNDQIRQIMT